MRVLIFSQYFWPENFRINEVACALKEYGCEVEVITGKPNYPEGRFIDGYQAWGFKRETWKHIPVYRVPMLPRGYKSPVRLVLNYLSFVISGLLFAPWMLRGKKYDVIFVYAPSPIFQAIPASFLGWVKRVPVVLWVQDLWPQSAEATGYVNSSWMLAFLEKAVRFTYSHTDLLLVQSEAFIKPVSKLAGNVPVTYYPNSADGTFYNPCAVDFPEVEPLKSGFSVLFAGNMGKAQALDTIVAAAKRLCDYPDIKIVILGSGSEEERIRKQIVDKKITNLYLEGRFPVETMPALMRQASALLVTLTNQPIFELTIPSKMQAYLAVGKPIIACLNGEGSRLIIKAKAGIAAAAENDQELADAIIKLYQMSEAERVQLGLNGQAYNKKHFDEKVLTEVLVEHFRALIEKFKKDIH